MPRVPLGTYWKVEARIDCWQSQSEKQMEREQAASARRAQRFYLTAIRRSPKVKCLPQHAASPRARTPSSLTTGLDALTATSAPARGEPANHCPLPFFDWTTQEPPRQLAFRPRVSLDT